MSANKEVKVTFRGVDRTREAFDKIKQRFKHLQHNLHKVKLEFGKIGNIIALAFGTHMIKKIIDTGEKIGKLSNKLGISTHALSELKYAAEKCDVSLSTLTSGMKSMAINIEEAAHGSGGAAEALKLLGLSAKDLHAVDANKQIELIAENLSRVSSESDRLRLAIEIFGSSGGDLLKMLEKGASGINNFREEAKKLGLSLSKEQCNAMAKFNQELSKLNSILTGLMTNVLIPILPVLNGFFEAIRDGHPIITFIFTSVSMLLGLKLAVWFIGAAAAVKTFAASLLSLHLGKLGVAISIIVSGLISFVKWTKKSTKVTDEFKKTVEAVPAIVIPKQSITDMTKRNELLGDAKHIFEQTRTPLEKHNAQVEKLNKLLKQGLIDQDTFNRAMIQSLDGLEQTEQKVDDVFSLIKEHSNDASKSLIDNFADAAFGVGGQVKSLKETFSDFFKSLQADILKMTLKEAILGANGVGSLFSNGSRSTRGTGSMNSIGSLGSMFAGFFANGGTAKRGKAHIVGDGGEPELFIPNSIGSIVPFSKLPSGTGGMNGSNIVVNMNIQTPDINSFNHSRSQIISDMARQISRSSRNL